MKRILLLFAMWFFLLGSDALAYQLPPGLSGDISEAIQDFLGGENRAIENLKKALEQYANAPSCKSLGGDSSLGLRQLYDALVFVGDILCSLKLTCFTKYIRDFFPLPVLDPDNALRDSFWGAENVAMVGRWFNLYRPVEILGETYARQRTTLGQQTATSPHAFLIYPDLQYPEGTLGYTGIALLFPKGDKNILGSFKEGNLVHHVVFALGRSDPLDLQNASEIALTAAAENLPGVIVVTPQQNANRPARTFLIIGSTAPKNAIRPITVPQECQSQEARYNASAYFELVGRIPYFWNNLVTIALPMIRTLTEFSEKSEEQEKRIKKGEAP